MERNVHKRPGVRSLIQQAQSYKLSDPRQDYSRTQENNTALDDTPKLNNAPRANRHERMQTQRECTRTNARTVNMKH